MRQHFTLPKTSEEQALSQIMTKQRFVVGIGLPLYVTLFQGKLFQGVIFKAYIYDIVQGSDITIDTVTGSGDSVV